MYEQKVKRAYNIELWSSIAVYVVVLVLSIRYGRPLADGPLRTAILLSPMLGFALMIRAIARHIARIDEYQRKFLLETSALAFAITGGITFTYGFLETAGFPRLSMFSVWMVMGASWGAVNIVRVILLRMEAA